MLKIYWPKLMDKTGGQNSLNKKNKNVLIKTSS